MSICDRLPPWVKRFPVGSPAFLIAVRVIPGFGGTVATATAATFRVPMWVHVWTMCAIAVPICALLYDLRRRRHDVGARRDPPGRFVHATLLSHAPLPTHAFS